MCFECSVCVVVMLMFCRWWIGVASVPTTAACSVIEPLSLVFNEQLPAQMELIAYVFLCLGSASSSVGPLHHSSILCVRLPSW